MRFRTLVLRLRRTVGHVRRHGLLRYLIALLQRIEASRAAKHEKQRHDIHLPVFYEDALLADPHRALPRWPGTTNQRLRFNWIMSPPGKGSGGHQNIFRFIRFLEEAGHENRIYLYSNSEHGPVKDIRLVMGSSYPRLDAPMEWLEDDADMLPADGMFATSWETAYPAFNSKLEARRFYFVQDFEPAFYPVGSRSVLAENTYRFGFFGITAGGWLAEKLRTEYGMRTHHYDFASDPALYRHTNNGPRREVLFYVRPFTERRGFEIGVMALDLFHRQHPEYQINLVGWDVSVHAIPFPYKNLKTLELKDLSALYNRCAAGLVLSYTNLSLLPLELLGSGTIPVVNDAPNTRMVSNNPYIAYAATDPASLAAALSEIVSRPEAIAQAKAAAGSVLQTSWADSGREFVDVVERETRNRE